MLHLVAVLAVVTGGFTKLLDVLDRFGLYLQHLARILAWYRTSEATGHSFIYAKR
jgi:hypothetical protein